MSDDALMRWETEGGALGVANRRQSLGSNGRGGPVHQEPTSDSAFALAASALALAMLALLAVLILADVVGLAQMLPFFVLPPALLVAAAFLLQRWATGEAEASAARETVHRQREKGRQP
jgi:hypothetical protein